MDLWNIEIDEQQLIHRWKFFKHIIRKGVQIGACFVFNHGMEMLRLCLLKCSTRRFVTDHINTERENYCAVN